MIGQIKDLLYFPIAFYFRFWAKIQLSRWNPKVIVVTGSSGKTTLLHLIESQLGDKARFSHHANSSYGIPFDILGLRRKTLTLLEWPLLFLKAPFRAFKKPYNEEVYVVEADCDRPYEGKFLSTLLRPQITLWTNSTRTHSMNFDKSVENGKFQSVEEAIAYEFGYFLEETQELCVVNGDSQLIRKQLPRTKAKVEPVIKKNLLRKYTVLDGQTEFTIGERAFSIKFLLPEDAFYLIAFTLTLLKHLDLKPDFSFSKFSLPPGRSSFFKGVKNISIIDSSYNSNLGSATAILHLFDSYPSRNKWVVIGDMLEQGKEEQIEHEKLASIVGKMDLSHIVLMGPRVSQYTYPKLKSQLGDSVLIEKFETPDKVLEYLQKNMQGEEAILFKGARFLEGVIEKLLLNKADTTKLCRREKIWELRRKKFGL